jgi:hypothetical protein
MDAIRDSDNMQVAFKRIDLDRYSHEMEIAKFLCSDQLATDPRNHCAPLLDVIDVPDSPRENVLVYQWYLPVNCPPFETIGDSLEFFRQVLEVGYQS